MVNTDLTVGPGCHVKPIPKRRSQDRVPSTEGFQVKRQRKPPHSGHCKPIEVRPRNPWIHPWGGNQTSLWPSYDSRQSPNEGGPRNHHGWVSGFPASPSAIVVSDQSRVGPKWRRYPKHAPVYVPPPFHVCPLVAFKPEMRYNQGTGTGRNFLA